MPEKLMNKGMINGDLVVRGLTINIYTDGASRVETPQTGDIIINKGTINGDVVFQNPAVNIYVNNVREKATVIEAEFSDIGEAVFAALGDGMHE